MAANSRIKLDKYIGVYMEAGNEKRRAFRGGKPDYCFYIDYIGADGKKKWKRIGWQSDGFSAQYASGVRAEIVKAIRGGEQMPYGKKNKIITMNELWKVYAEKHLNTVKQPENDEGRYRNYIAPVFGELPLDKISPLDLETFKQNLLKTKTVKGKEEKAKTLSPATVRHILRLISNLYNKAGMWGLYAGKPPLENVKMPKVDNARFRHLSTEEAGKLLDALRVQSPVWWKIAYISLSTGMRLGEILNLKGSDINLDACLIHVRDAKAGTRVAHIPEGCRPLFAELMPARPDHYLFTNKNGQPMQGKNTSHIFARIVERLGFNDGISDARQKVVFHTLRHTFASWLAIDGKPLYTIAELMGHKTLEMTRRYAHLCPDSKQAVVNSIGNRLHVS